MKIVENWMGCRMVKDTNKTNKLKTKISEVKHEIFYVKLSSCNDS